MLPIYQTKFGKEGNCFQACLASIMEVPLEAIPEAVCHEPDVWLQPFKDWLNERNLCVIEFDTTVCKWHPMGYGIGTVKSPRGDFYHAVVTYADEIVHDPHPDSDAKSLPLLFQMVFYLVDPSKLKEHPNAQ